MEILWIRKHQQTMINLGEYTNNGPLLRIFLKVIKVTKIKCEPGLHFDRASFLLSKIMSGYKIVSKAGLCKMTQSCCQSYDHNDWAQKEWPHFNSGFWTQPFFRSHDLLNDLILTVDSEPKLSFALMTCCDLSHYQWSMSLITWFPGTWTRAK